MTPNTVKGLIVGLGVLGAWALLAVQPASGNLQGKKAPAFDAMATDGEKHTLKSHIAKGTTFLYFIKEGCPVNHQAAPHVQKLAKAYGLKGNLVGVYNGSVRGAKEWAKAYKATFPIIEDPSLKVIRAYGAAYSPWIVAVNKDGSVEKVFEGASPRELAEVNTLMAATAGAKLAKLDFSGSPTGGG